VKEAEDMKGERRDLMAEREEAGEDLGQLFISDKALEMIAYGALLDMEGLYTPDRVKGGGILGSISKAYQGAGIQVLKVPVAPEEGEESFRRPEGTGEEGEKQLKIKLSLVARYGTPIHSAAEQAIQKVRRRVKELAGLDVGEVEVEITDIVKMP
jgi:uncharacterized alkaline shock family protein YloU